MTFHFKALEAVVDFARRYFFSWIFQKRHDNFLSNYETAKVGYARHRIGIAA